MNYQILSIRYFILYLVTTLILGGLFLPNIGSARVTTPKVVLSKSLDRIIIAREGVVAPSGCTPSSTMVDFRISTTGFEGKNIGSDVVVTAGRVIIGKNKFLWDLTGTMPGTYLAIVDAKSEKNEIARTTGSIEINEC